MKKLMTSQNVFDDLKQFHAADPEAVRQHDQSVRDHVVPESKSSFSVKSRALLSARKTSRFFDTYLLGRRGLVGQTLISRFDHSLKSGGRIR